MGSRAAVPRCDDASPTKARYLVLALLCLMSGIAYIPRNYIGVAEKKIRTEMRLSTHEMSWVLGAFFITYAVVQIPSGWLGHVWGTRRALTLFSLVGSILTAASALAVGFPALLLTRLGMGAAQAGIFPAATNTIAQWFPLRRRALANGLLGSSMHVGGALTAMLTGVLLTQMNWRWLVALYALPGVIWAVWFFVWFRDRPEDHAAVNAAERNLIRGPSAVPSAPPPAGREFAEQARETTPWLALFTSPAMACICGQQFFRAAGYMFYTSWFTTFLQQKGSLTVDEAGFLTSLPIWATVLGSCVGGFLSDFIWVRTGSRRLSRQWLLVGSQLLCALLIVLAYLVTNVSLAALVIAAGAFCAAIGGPCAYTITIDMGGNHVAPVFSTMNMAGNVGAAVFPLLVPPLVNATGSWDLVLFLFAGIYLAAGLCWIPFNPNGTIFDQSPFAPRVRS